MGRAGFKAWPLSRPCDCVQLCCWPVLPLYNQSTQILIQKSPACEGHLPLRHSSVVSPRFENYIIVCLTFPNSQAPSAGLHGCLLAVCPADLFPILWLLPTTPSLVYLKDV